MSDPLMRAFFVGRAAAEILSERAESSFSDALSELGKLDAELRESLRQFSQDVIERSQVVESTYASRPSPSTSATTGGAGMGPDASGETDVQTSIDDLRAEAARLRSELKQHRNQTSS